MTRNCRNCSPKTSGEIGLVIQDPIISDLKCRASYGKQRHHWQEQSFPHSPALIKLLLLREEVWKSIRNQTTFFQQSNIQTYPDQITTWMMLFVRCFWVIAAIFIRPHPSRNEYNLLDCKYNKVYYCTLKNNTLRFVESI